MINAKALAAGLAKHGYRIVSGGTDNHLMLVDLRPKDLNGKEAQEVLDRAGITVNKNAIPFDTSSPFKPGGIRVGTPAVTTRGMKEEEMLEIAELVAEALDNRSDEGAHRERAQKSYRSNEQISVANLGAAARSERCNQFSALTDRAYVNSYYPICENLVICE